MIKTITILLGLWAISFGQTERWVHHYNGPGNGVDIAHHLICAPDNNIYAAGFSYSTTSHYDLTILSLTPAGTENWVYQYNGPGNSADDALSVVYGADGNIYAAGNSYGGSTTLTDFTVVSVTSTGSERWAYRYCGAGNYNDVASSVVYGADGNIYAAGRSVAYTNEDFTVISLTSTGSERWVYTYDGPGSLWDKAHSIIYGSDGNIYAVGYSYANGTAKEDFMVISLTTAGSERWVYRYNGPGNDFDEARSIVYGDDNNIYAAGGTFTSDAVLTDFTVISLTTAGSERWVYTYNGPGNYIDCALSLYYGSDGNVYASGYSNGGSSQEDFTILSVTSAGSERWVYTYNGPGNDVDKGNSVIRGADGNVYVAGYSQGSAGNPDFMTVSLTSDGNERWVYRYDRQDFDIATSVAYGTDGNVYSSGYCLGSTSAYDLTVVSLDPQTGIEENLPSVREKSHRILVTVNPVKDCITFNRDIEGFICNALGQKVMDVVGNSADISDLPVGSYLVIDEKERVFDKIIKLK